MGVIHSLKALSQISFCDFRTLPFLFACLFSLAGAGSAASETPPRIQPQFGGIGVQSDLACYFAGRWVTTGLGTAVIRVDGRQLSGVMSQFDDSLAQNLYRMEFRANIDPTGRQAKGEHSYSFMTGAGFSYSGSITLTLSPDLSRLSIVFTNPIPIEDSFLKVLSGECR